MIGMNQEAAQLQAQLSWPKACGVSAIESQQGGRTPLVSVLGHHTDLYSIRNRTAVIRIHE